VIGLVFIYFLPAFRNYFNGTTNQPERTNSSADINLDGAMQAPPEQNSPQ
jgi:hypothetical protein